MVEDRIFGQKDIVTLFTKLYGITSYVGVWKFTKRENFPLRKTPTGRPFVILSEAKEFDAKFRCVVNKS